MCVLSGLHVPPAHACACPYPHPGQEQVGSKRPRLSPWSGRQAPREPDLHPRKGRARKGAAHPPVLVAMVPPGPWPASPPGQGDRPGLARSSIRPQPRTHGSLCGDSMRAPVPAHYCVGQATPGVVCVRVLCGVLGPCGLMPTARGQPRLQCPHVCQHMHHPQVMCLPALVAVCGRGQPSVRSVFCCGRACHWTAAPHAPTGYPPWFGGARSLHAPTRDTRLRSHGHVRAHVCRAAFRVYIRACALCSCHASQARHMCYA